MPPNDAAQRTGGFIRSSGLYAAVRQRADLPQLQPLPVCCPGPYPEQPRLLRLEGVSEALHLHRAASAEGPGRLERLATGREEVSGPMTPDRRPGRATPAAGRGCRCRGGHLPTGLIPKRTAIVIDLKLPHGHYGEREWVVGGELAGSWRGTSVEHPTVEARDHVSLGFSQRRGTLSRGSPFRLNQRRAPERRCERG